jgi:ribosomal protein S25
LEIFYYNLLWTGKVKNYKRDSTWIGVDTRTGKVLHSEEFKQGKFIRGKTWAKEGVITYNRVSSSIPSKLISKIKKEVKKEIIVKVGKVKTKYKIGLLFRDGQIIEVRHLIRDINEEQINLTGVIIPTGFIFLERGLPIEWMTLGVKL